ncbi:hypothetical protein FACS1894186_1030 [Alphaproteobacteria bacterium]|nr:hypothetical protein FACS1894186_1030 [Alphaproteobacteria bacterium]
MTANAQTPTWLVSFVDLISILLAFFVLLLAMSAPDAAKYRKLAESLSLSSAAPETDGAAEVSRAAARGRAGTAYLAALFAAWITRDSALAPLAIHARDEEMALTMPLDGAFADGSLTGAAREAAEAAGERLSGVDNSIAVRVVAPYGALEANLAAASAVAGALRDGGVEGDVAAVYAPAEDGSRRLEIVVAAPGRTAR